MDSEGAQFSPSSSSSSFPFLSRRSAEKVSSSLFSFSFPVYTRRGEAPKEGEEEEGCFGGGRGSLSRLLLHLFFPFFKEKKKKKKILLISRSSEGGEGWVAKESRFMGREKEEEGQNLLHGILKTGDKLLLLKLSEIFRGKRKNPLLAGSKQKKNLFWPLWPAIK